MKTTPRTGEDRKGSSFPLRLPPSMRYRIEQLAQMEGVSLNQFIAMTLAEKLGAADREFFEQRRRSADIGDLLKFLNRKGGEPPR